jgi:hypothetical protein
MTAFGTMPPPAHHLQLYRLLASPEMRDFITPTGSWAVTIDGSQLASIPADFLAGIAIAIDADAAYSRAGPAPPVAAPVLPSSSLLRAANAAALTPSEQAAFASQLLAPGLSRGMAHGLLGGFHPEAAGGAAAAAAAAADAAAPTAHPPAGVFPLRAPALHKFLSDPHDRSAAHSSTL